MAKGGKTTQRSAGANPAPAAAKRSPPPGFPPRIRAPLGNDASDRFDMQVEAAAWIGPLAPSDRTQMSWSMVSAATGFDPGRPRAIRVKIQR